MKHIIVTCVGTEKAGGGKEAARGKVCTVRRSDLKDGQETADSEKL